MSHAIDWDAEAELWQAPAPGDFIGSFDAIGPDEIVAPLGLLVKQHMTEPDDIRPYRSICFRGRVIEADEIERMGASESFKSWLSQHQPASR